MSRIEQALEKAARQREHNPEFIPVPSAEAASAPSAERGNGHRERDAALLLANPLPVSSPFLVAPGNKNNPAAAEEYRKLKSLVLRLTRGERFLNTLLITSAGSNEGKTLTALNLAIVLAQEYDHSVVLIDADLRRPSVHRYLGIKPEVGLAQCLQDHLPVARALVKTGLGRLVVLPAGGVVADPVELLSSARMKDILRELKSRYPDRYVIIDTPPSAPFADAQMLGQVVDGVLFVVREGVARTNDIREGLGSLKDANLLGVVYNDVSFTPGNGRYYYY
ncbi:MAG TPA: polysaccharide biosynthesis tyrosine autokinase [Desulfuromonadales bacterium]|nr:polysaccharide biosynthesis tyrosine autokinase [Desulfuromonadales bacterium]